MSIEPLDGESRAEELGSQIRQLEAVDSADTKPAVEPSIAAKAAHQEAEMNKVPRLEDASSSKGSIVNSTS